MQLCKTQSFALLLAVAFLAAADGHAADMQYESGSMLSVTGPIDLGDGNKFSEILESDLLRLVSTNAVLLNSPGGSVADALEIARLVDKYKLTAIVASEKKCASSCFLIWVSAPVRLAIGEIYVHRPYLPEAARRDMNRPEWLRRQNDALKAAKEFLENRFVPDDIISHLINTPSNDAYKLSEQNISQIGVAAPSWDELIVSECDISTRSMRRTPDIDDLQCVRQVSFDFRIDVLERNYSLEAAVYVERKFTNTRSRILVIGQGGSTNEHLQISDIDASDGEDTKSIIELWNSAIERAQRRGLAIRGKPRSEVELMGQLVSEVWPFLAAHGDGESAYQLGSVLILSQQFSDATRYFILASQLGDWDALLVLSTSYLYGDGVEIDLHKAYAYIDLYEEKTGNHEAAKRQKADMDTSKLDLDAVRRYRNDILSYLPANWLREEDLVPVDPESGEKQ